MYSPLCLSNLWCSGLPSVLISLMDPRRVVNFSVHFSLLVRTEWQLPSVLHVEPENRILCLISKLLLPGKNHYVIKIKKIFFHGITMLSKTYPIMILIIMCIFECVCGFFYFWYIFTEFLLYCSSNELVLIATFVFVF